MKNYNLIATCAFGLESLVCDEIRIFGGLNITSGSGLVIFRGNLETAYRSCLWSRYASRIFLEIMTCTVDNEEALYQKSFELNWNEHLENTTTFAINSTISGKGPVTNNRFAGLKIKDGLVDFFRKTTGQRPNVQADKPDVQFHLHINNSRAALYLDLSGESLHRRGYRASGTIAPLKENLGAAIVALSGWPVEFGNLLDPMCGSGTLLIEAALIFGNFAPGLSRKYFGFYGWKKHDSSLWQRLVDEAAREKERGMEKEWPLFQGYDADYLAIGAARKNIKMAGLENYIQVRQADLTTLSAPAISGTVLSNLPYGERLSEKDIVAKLYRAFGRVLQKNFSNWKVGAFISNPDLTDSFGIVWREKHKLYNGSIPCRLLIGDLQKNEQKEFLWNPQFDPGKVKAEEGINSDLANRLRKNLKKTLKWAKRENITCFRVYDRDLPEFNLSVDIYGKWVHVQEYSAPGQVDSNVAAARFKSALATIKNVLDVRSDRVFIKTRKRQKGKKQYEKRNIRNKMFEVREGCGFFLVNFTDYIDTGLFLDHRLVREKIYREAKGKRFLNLFAYTGSATVYAALGGAISTTTVDLSATYLNWAKMNLALNGISEINHKLVKKDSLQFLEEDSSKYDLIFIDPPTFSNTKKEKRVFDIQKDHQKLLENAMNRLDRNGLLIFSTNFRRFTLDEKLCELYVVTDISGKTIPFDFLRNKKIHMCWELKHKAQKS